MILYVSFTTRPGAGSEGGVGWHFLKAHAEYARTTGQKLIALIDNRDEEKVRRSIADEIAMSHVHLISVAIPKILQPVWADRRTRLSYLFWYLRAQKIAHKIIRHSSVTIVHQATFATASLPPILPKKVPVRLWGPIAIPEAVAERNRVRRLLEALAIYGLRVHARIFSRFATLLLAQNDFTLQLLNKWHRPTVLEPNIVISPKEKVVEKHCPPRPYFVVCGVLIDRKRPWVALEAFLAPEFEHMDLVVAGSGPLGAELQDRYKSNALHGRRIHFVGNVLHSEAMGLLKNANALLHPAKREGAPWVVGEATSFGTPVILLGQSGASAILRLSNGSGSIVSDSGDEESAIHNFRNAMKLFTAGRESVEDDANQTRWSESRLPSLISRAVDESRRASAEIAEGWTVD